MLFKLRVDFMHSLIYTAKHGNTSTCLDIFVEKKDGDNCLEINRRKKITSADLRDLAHWLLECADEYDNFGIENEG